jgi:hypothetical protein
MISSFDKFSAVGIGIALCATHALSMENTRFEMKILAVIAFSVIPLEHGITCPYYHGVK